MFWRIRVGLLRKPLIGHDLRARFCGGLKTVFSRVLGECPQRGARDCSRGAADYGAKLFEPLTLYSARRRAAEHRLGKPCGTDCRPMKCSPGCSPPGKRRHCRRQPRRPGAPRLGYTRLKCRIVSNTVERGVRELEVANCVEMPPSGAPVSSTGSGELCRMSSSGASVSSTGSGELCRMRRTRRPCLQLEVSNCVECRRARRP